MGETCLPTPPRRLQEFVLTPKVGHGLKLCYPIIGCFL